MGVYQSHIDENVDRGFKGKHVQFLRNQPSGGDDIMHTIPNRTVVRFCQILHCPK